MPKPRYAQVSLEATPYYHCVSRCVRRAFLCGHDTHTDQSYEHRRGWIEDKLLQLGAIFSIDIAAYAIMSNHYHVVLHIDKAQAEGWSPKQIVDRWHQLFSGHPLSQRYAKGDTLSRAEWTQLEKDINTWRQRLMDISWFMRVLNESIARLANSEDDCTGRFWEGRFKSQALLDERALAACMAYVDLNPIRATMARTPEESAYTSIQQRIQQALISKQPHHTHQQPRALLPFAGYPRHGMPKGLPFRLDDYLALVDWTGRIIREDQRGAIPSHLPPLLQRLNIEPQHWLYMTQHFESKFKRFVGTAFRLKQVCESLGYQRTVGLAPCKKFLSTS